MNRLPITVVTWDYDRVRAITDGRVRIEGCDVNYLTMLPEGFPLTSRNGASLSQMLANGELDGVMSARTPLCFIKRHQQVRRLFPD